MNWGKGILLGMTIFILYIMGMCIYMFMAPQDDYDHQYYEKGLNFDRDYGMEMQVVKDHARPGVQVNKHTLKLIFTKPVKGRIAFMRPSDTRLDKMYKLDSGTGNEADIQTGDLAAGKWQLVMNWESDHKSYLYRQGIYLYNER